MQLETYLLTGPTDLNSDVSKSIYTQRIKNKKSLVHCSLAKQKCP